MAGYAVANFIWEYFYWIFLAVLVVNLTQRKHLKTGEKKRFATLYLAVGVFAIYVFAGMLMQFKLPEILLLPFLLVLAGTAWYFRRHLLPFRFSCASCGKRLDWQRIMYHDNNLCLECDPPAPAEEPEAAEQEEEEEEKPSTDTDKEDSTAD